jgi:hypothetical protein
VCYSRPAYENPQTTSFVEVDEVGSDNSYKRLFTGWMFALSPGLNAIEHPVYDIWLAECKGGKDIIKTPPEVEDEPPPPAPAELRRNPRQAQPLPGTRPPGPGGATSAPLRLPGAPGAPPGAVLPPGNVAQPPRPAPQQRFFPTNQGMGGLRDPAGQGR